MCPPALVIAATAVAAIGTAMSTMQAAKSATYQSRIAERNSQLSNEAARTEQENTRTEALRRYREIGALKGQQRTALAGNNVDLDYGNAALIQDDAEMMGREDVRHIYNQGFQRSRGFEIEAANYRGQSQAQRQARTGAIISGVTQIGTTVLGGAQQYKSIKAGRS